MPKNSGSCRARKEPETLLSHKQFKILTNSHCYKKLNFHINIKISVFENIKITSGIKIFHCGQTKFQHKRKT